MLDEFAVPIAAVRQFLVGACRPRQDQSQEPRADRRGPRWLADKQKATWYDLHQRRRWPATSPVHGTPQWRWQRTRAKQRTQEAKQTHLARVSLRELQVIGHIGQRPTNLKASQQYVGRVVKGSR